MNKTNADKAVVIREAINSARRDQYGLYTLRLCLFKVLDGTALDAAWVAEKLLPRAGQLDDESFLIIQMLPGWINSAREDDLVGLRNIIETYLLLINANYG